MHPPILTDEEQAKIALKLKTLDRLKTIHRLDEANVLDFEEIKPFPISMRFKDFNLPEYRILRPGTMVLGGEASSGKTTLSLQLAVDMLLNDLHTNLIFFSLDESIERAKRKIFSLILANQDKLPRTRGQGRYNLVYKPITPKLRELLEQESYQQVLSRVFITDNAYFLEPGNDGFINLIAHAYTKRIIIVVDYLQLLPRGNSTSNLRENFNNTLAYLKQQVNRLNHSESDVRVLLILLSQVSRNTQGVSTFNFRETSEIENIADTALVLEYVTDIKSSASGRNKEQTIALARQLRLLKNKDGARATFSAMMASDIPFFQDVDLVNQKYTPETTVFRV